MKAHLKLWISNNVHNHNGSDLDLKLTLAESLEDKYFWIQKPKDTFSRSKESKQQPHQLSSITPLLYFFTMKAVDFHVHYL